MGEQVWRTPIGWSWGILEVSQKTPLFFSPRNFDGRLTPSPIVYNILSSEKQKMPRSFGYNINSLNTAADVWSKFTIADRSQILAWLSPLEPRLRHQDIQDHRAENVGEWLLQTEEFRSWYAGSGGGESDNAILFCYGDPGVGKTYIR